MGFLANIGRFLMGMVVSYFPDRYRRKLGFLDIGDMRTPALISGILQFVGLLILIILRYPAFVNSMMAGQSMEKAQLGAMEKGGETAVMGFGLVLLAAYLVHPVTLVLEYFCLEGFVRSEERRVGKECRL